MKTSQISFFAISSISPSYLDRRQQSRLHVLSEHLHSGSRQGSPPPSAPPSMAALSTRLSPPLADQKFEAAPLHALKADSLGTFNSMPSLRNASTTRADSSTVKLLTSRVT